MGEWEQECAGCKDSHLAALWYYREGERDMEHWMEWICGSKYGELSTEEKGRWLLWEAG